ncbi:MAG TPA: hypothetical protein PKX87_06735 [Alphaproteobacteria bacterium]|nr:hypothetical protein [Alphaproteobacteria bacterium]
MRDEPEIERLETELERRYGAAFMQDISDRLAAAREREAAARDIRALDGAVNRARARTRDLLRQLRGARMEDRLARRDGAGAEPLWRAYEHRFLAGQVGDSFRLYRKANRDYHAARRLSLERLFRIGSASTRAAAG